MIQPFLRTARAGRKRVPAFLLVSWFGAAVLALCAGMAETPQPRAVDGPGCLGSDRPGPHRGATGMCISQRRQLAVQRHLPGLP